jgi:hypothetical protein
MPTKRRKTSRIEFQSELQEMLEPYLVENLHYQGALAYKILIEGKNYFVWVGMPAEPAKGGEKFVKRLMRTVEVVFSIPPNQLMHQRGLNGRIAREIILQVLRETRVMSVNKLCEIEAKGNRHLFYTKLIKLDDFKHPIYGPKIRHAEEIIREHFYTNFKFDYERAYLNRRVSKSSKRPSLPEGVIMLPRQPKLDQDN